ncbi:DUF732 domain-containing protein [Mycobacterium simiae]|uniref:DUF732 domain-containing protein n=2 Tax=Mycobacterium simiae TaxID=1784 RepID=A0A5B1BK27_MYCSI|nr:DUF732 domain-containing protein [Mycobacterium simiae]
MTFMAEPVPASDKTAALDDARTAAVPNSAPTDPVHAGWSRNENADDSPDTAGEPAVQSWRTTWGRAAALLLVGLGSATLIIVGGWALNTTKSPNEGVAPSSAAQTAPQRGATAPTTSAPAPAATIASTPEQDSRYIAALNDRGITFANPEAAIYNGKLVCMNFRQGMTVQQIVAEFRASNPGLSNSADAYVAISMRTYCP